MNEFEQYLNELSEQGFTFEQKVKKLSDLGIPFRVENGTIVSESCNVTDCGEDSSALTIMECMSAIVENITNGPQNQETFNEKIFSEKAAEIRFVGKKCGTTPWQTLLLAMVIEKSCRRHFSKEDLAECMGLNYIKLLSYEKDLQYLHEQRLILLQKNGQIHLPKNVIPALTLNKKYERPNRYNLTTPALLKVFKSIIKQKLDEEMDECDMVEDLDELMDSNPDCTFVKVSRQYKILGDEHVSYPERIIFYNLVYRYLYEDDDVVGWHDFEDIFDEEDDISPMRSLYKRDEMELQIRGIIEPAYEDGFADADYFHIKDDIKEQLFEEVGGLRKKARRGGRLKVMPTKDIQAKELFYNPTEAEQVRRLSSLLSESNYKMTCKRLKDSGMRTGFSCIFYGSPGTGKTETVYQIARQTGRAIVPVNVSEIKSCWVGESEKMIQGVFNKYRALVEDSEVAPILLFNEADAIFGIRREAATDAVDKMENSIQNIILQEMEKLDGILIATTNLTQNLDKAFERRFLYKIKFNKPSVEAKGKIWKSLLPSLTEQEAGILASNYDFSGGQIENVSRKKVIQTIIDGREPDFDEVRSYCSEELLEGKGGEGRRIGF